MELIVPLPPTGESRRAQQRRLHYAIAIYVQEMAEGRRPSPTLGRELLDGVIELVFRTAIREGWLRLPGAWGALSVVHRHPAPWYRSPAGERIKMPPVRSRLSYSEGAAVSRLLGKNPRSNRALQFPRVTQLTPAALKAAKLTR